MSKKRFNYADAETSQTGLMICGACRKPIAEGQYRYRETEAAYITHHRKCSSDDPEWAKRDAASEKALQRSSALRIATIAFRDAWRVDDLDELIGDLS